MIRDLSADDAGQILNADVAIVGAGPAGIALALELESAGVRIALIEAGSQDYSDSSQDHYRGEVIGRPYPDLETTRLRMLGGSGNHWTGWCRPLDPVDFEDRFGDGGWPLGPEDLATYYEKAQEFCQLGPFQYDGDFWAADAGQTLLDLETDALESTVVQLSPPTNFSETYFNRLESAALIEVLLHATVTDLRSSDNGNSIDEIVLSTPDGRESTCRARFVVLAAGGLENPRILLNATAQGVAGVGNKEDLVGRYFMEHPFYPVCRIMPSASLSDVAFYEESWTETRQARRGRDTDAGPLEVKGLLRLSDAVQRAEGLNNTLFWLENAGNAARQSTMNTARHAYNKVFNGVHWQTLDNDAGLLLRNLDHVLNRVLGTSIERSREPLNVTAILEQRPNYASRVTLSDARDALGQRRIALDWQWQASDKSSLRQSLNILTDTFVQAGYGRIRTLIDDDALNLGYAPTHASHHMGTTRMSSDPRRGVVDADCRVHTTQNLYVAGSSVFPTSGSSNPTLTIVALSVRLAQHLKERLA